MTDNTWLDRWDERYDSEQFAYGTDPNHYLKEQLNKLIPGNILFPAEGEGRNAVFAATKGWNVSAFDISANGQKKAFQLAEHNHVNIDYQVGELSTLNYQQEQFDVIALIYAHFPASVKSSIHQMLNQYLRKGGFIIFEAFSKNHLEYIAKDEKVGGPKDIESLFSIDEIKADFPDYNIVELSETEIDLNEGLFHNGTGSVIRFVGQKM
ncbi:class I SAM-dependent methyltransferase [Chryseobacterium sp. SIMBA_028]|uniref:class I SAM-dependent methyltransferase n=1 Tax=Chryseobacterium sp. SIMBA_028 TaxID=3085771 RepID=UPI00397DABA5